MTAAVHRPWPATRSRDGACCATAWWPSTTADCCCPTAGPFFPRRSRARPGRLRVPGQDQAGDEDDRQRHHPDQANRHSPGEGKQGIRTATAQSPPASVRRCARIGLRKLLRDHGTVCMSAEGPTAMTTTAGPAGLREPEAGTRRPFQDAITAADTLTPARPDQQQDMSGGWPRRPAAAWPVFFRRCGEREDRRETSVRNETARRVGSSGRIRSRDHALRRTHRVGDMISYQNDGKGCALSAEKVRKP